MPWEFFNDGRPPVWHIHGLRKKKIPSGPLKQFVSREGWNAARRAMQPYDDIIYTDLPVHTVRFTYTDTWRCENPEECQRLIRELQENHMAKYTFDIKWNFLIAPDGTIYEGRGWDFDAFRPMKYDHLKGKCIDIAYIGNYIARPISRVMKLSANDFINWGVVNGMIHCCYLTIPHTDPQIDDNNRDPPFRVKFYNEYDNVKEDEGYREIIVNP